MPETRFHRGLILSFTLLIIGLAWMLLAQTTPAPPDQSRLRLWHDLSQYRNLGKAFYENPTTQKQAADEFRKALALAPASARERINYGLALLRAGDAKTGIAELQRARNWIPGFRRPGLILESRSRKRATWKRPWRSFKGWRGSNPKRP